MGYHRYLSVVNILSRVLFLNAKMKICKNHNFVFFMGMKSYLTHFFNDK